MFARYTKRGFTLVEILIVVIILGILAAIVIPQFTNASQDARKSSLVSQLQTLRSQIELFKLQHGDQLPDLATSWDPLTTVTTYNGVNFGPYMQAVPKNPLNNLITVANTASLTTPAAGTGVGFMYNYTVTNPGDGTGRIWGTSDSAGNVIYIE
ncbi:MAG: prepilin-type N-terminal cleavage/methylation domain-containing protein [Tepidisphaerales bacterium]